MGTWQPLAGQMMTKACTTEVLSQLVTRLLCCTVLGLVGEEAGARLGGFEDLPPGVAMVNGIGV